MGFFSSLTKAVSNIGKTVSQSIQDIPGSVKGFVNNPLQSVEKGLGQTVNAASLGTIGKVGGGKLVKDVGAGVLTAGTGTLAYNALKPKNPPPKPAPFVGPPAPPPVTTAPVVPPIPVQAPPVDVGSQVLNTLGQIKAISGSSDKQPAPSQIPIPVYGFGNSGGPVATPKSNTGLYIGGGLAVAAILFALMRR